ncbi:uncharacterized protein LOC143266164 [Megachile rotundata]|uniref:uncharacterized protein LOC143266164 n=1 Tax=Megachile rotundata TaxID=143995 RepID=UPI003FD30EEF
MAKLDDLIAKQNRFMESVTRALTNFKKMGQAKMTLGVTRHRLTMLKENFAKCQELDAEILVHAELKTQNSHPYFTEERFLRCEEAFNEAADFMAEIITTAEQNQAIPSTSRLHFQEGRIATRLPQLRLPQFDGSFSAWETFRDKFSSLIINDQSLSNVDRMHYLSSCLIGDANSALAHLAITEANFPVAWKILTSRYENKRRLISFHIHALHNLPTVNSETYKNLRDLSDKVNASIQALINLDRPVKQWDDMLVYLVTQRLDTSTRKAWELHLGDSLDYPSFSKLNNFLDSRIRALESLPQPSYAKGRIISQTMSNSKSEQLKTVSVNSMSVSSACPVCQANHLIYQCAQFQNQTPAQRYAMIKNFKRCVNCFSAKHTVKDCASERSCKQCKRKHHTMLHFADITRSNSNDAITSSQPRNVTASANIATPPLSKMGKDATDALTANPTSLRGANYITGPQPVNHVNFKVPAPTSSVLLATARIRMFSSVGQFVCVRALLDQGSAITLITENLAQLLRLPKLKRSVCISGVGDTGTLVRHAVNILFTPLRASAPVFETTALVLKSLTKYVPNRVHSVDRWSHIENLNLADNDPMSSDPIDILIGADLYGSIILDGVRKGLVNQPIAQNTSLGWILSGPVAPSNDTLSAPSHHTLAWDTLNEDLRRFWEIEELHDKSHLTPEEIQCEEHFSATHS